MNASHPLTYGNPPRWANTWGQDRHGVFVGFVVDGIEYRMRWIKSGSFLMGSPAEEEGRFEGEGPQHEVTFTRGFWLGETPVTQVVWEAVMGSNPSCFKGPERPVEMVSWDDCQEFCARLEALAPHIGMRLPSEAEWEYACRAGTSGPTYTDAGNQALEQIAWWSGNSEQQTHPVREKQPNAWGLHDMLGNVWEWCSDGQRTYNSESAVDPSGPIQDVHRVDRGGGWNDDAKDVRAAYRLADSPSLRERGLGFRLARGQE